MDAVAATTLEEAQRKLVDAINKTLPSIPDSELSVEMIELPGGGAEFRYHMSEEVQAIFESVAALRGMTVNEYLRWTVLPNSKG